MNERMNDFFLEGKNNRLCFVVSSKDIRDFISFDFSDERAAPPYHILFY